MHWMLLFCSLWIGSAAAAEPAPTSATVVDRSKDYRQDQRPYKYYKAMVPTWTVGRVAAVAGPPIVLGSYLFTQASFNRDIDVDSGAEKAGFLLGSSGSILALSGPPIMLFGSLSALPALKKTGTTAKPTMGLVSAGLWLTSVGLYAATLSSFEDDPTSTTWKALGVAGTLTWTGSAFFANSQINNTHRAGMRSVGP